MSTPYHAGPARPDRHDDTECPDVDRPVEERTIPVHVPERIEQHARELAERHGGDVEEWVLRCLAFDVRLLLRDDRPDDARTHAGHATVDAETFAAVQASGRPERFVREAVRETVEGQRSPSDHV